jgi:hypothetical protein
MLYVFNYLISSFLYSNEQWDEYMALNESRHKIQLRAPEKYIANNLSEIGWNKEIYFMFVKFSLIDKSQMNTANLNRVLEINNEYVGPKSVLTVNFSELRPITIEAFNPWTWILKIQIIMIILIGVLKIKDKIFWKYIKFLTLQGIFLSILIVVLSVGYQIPERISLNLIAALTLSMIAQTINYQKLPIAKNRITNLSSIILLIIFVNLAISRISVETRAREGLYLTRQAFANQQSKSLSKLGNQVVISNGSGLKTHWRFPYTKWNSYDLRDKTIILGWHNLSPLSKDQFKIRNLDLGNFPSGVVNSEIYWVDSPEEISISRDYFQQFYEVDLVFSDEGNVGNDEYHFYRFSTIE